MSARDRDAERAVVEEAERQVLSVLLSGSEAQSAQVARVRELLGPATFSRDKHDKIFRAIESIVEHGDRAILTTVAKKLDRNGALTPGGWLAAISGILEHTATVGSLECNVRLVRDAWERRELRRVAWTAAQESEDATEPVAVILDRLQTQVAALSPEVSTWQPPIPFGDAPVPTFPTEVFPRWLRGFVEAEAIATQTPNDLPAMLGISVLSASLAGKIRVLVDEGYEEPVNTFTVTVLPPGNRKSGVFRDMTAPIEAFEKETAAVMREAVTCAEQRRRILELELKKAEARVAEAESGKRDELLHAAEKVRKEHDALKVPVPPRVIVDDCTPEKLASLLRDHDGRIALLSAEGDAFDIMAGRYSNNGSANLGVYLKGHAGDALRVDRQGRAPEFVSNPALTLGITVQPDVLRGLMTRPEFRGRGLLARCLFSVPTSTLGRRDSDAPPVPEVVRAEYERGIGRLLCASPAVDAKGAGVPGLVRFSPEARAALRDFQRWLEPQLGEFGSLAHITDWAGKLAGAVARLAGLLHVAEQPGRRAPWDLPLSRECVERSVAIGKYLLGHALGAFQQMGADRDVEKARLVLHWVLRAEVPTFTKREAFEATKGRFKKVADLEPALRVLEDHRYITARPRPPRDGPGRKPSPSYAVNPQALGIYSHNSRDGSGNLGSANTANKSLPGPGAEQAPEVVMPGDNA
ncbi:MAG: DUF3987 domain-containing protein [Candidatus Eisenbacteria bacterium]|nr:DUF3987 domain-containing protein [Candidatus Eisenbacteria bacterium]